MRQSENPLIECLPSGKPVSECIIAVDFDDCLCASQYPATGEPNIGLINNLLDFKKRGGELVLWTCREGQACDEAVAWCADYGLVFDAINDNTPKAKALYGNNPRKIGADLYIDDKALRCWIR